MIVEIMNLLLSLNNYGFSKGGEKVTMVMATHNPDVEIYADRIVYMRDGVIVKQSFNEKQFPIIYEHYTDYLKNKN